VIDFADAAPFFIQSELESGWAVMLWWPCYGVGAGAHPAEPRVGSFGVVIRTPLLKNSVPRPSDVCAAPLRVYKPQD